MRYTASTNDSTRAKVVGATASAVTLLAIATAVSRPVLHTFHNQIDTLDLWWRIMWSIGLGSVQWFVGLAFLPVFVWLALAPASPRKPMSLRPTVLAVLVGAFVVLVSTHVASPYRDQFPIAVLRAATLQYPRYVLPLAGLAAVVQTLALYRRNQQYRVAEERLLRQLAESRVAALTMQIRPHFLFNTLQGISTLMQRDVVAADAMLQQLSVLLRSTLEYRQSEVPLRKEIEVVRQYVAIVTMRYGERLRFAVDVSDEAADAAVPFFVLQPLIENAVEHGAETSTSTIAVTLRAYRRDDRLVMEIANQFTAPRSSRRGLGIGTENVRSRLEELYGDQQQFTLERRHDGAVAATVELPFNPACRDPRPA